MGKFAILLHQVALVPLFLKEWGAEYYGVWIVLSAIPTMLSMSNMGIGTAAATRIILEIGEGSEKKANDLFITSVVLAAAIYAVVIIGLIVCPMSLFQIGDNVIRNPQLTVSFLMGSAALTAISQPLEGYWVARQRAATGMLYATGLSITKLLTTVIVLLTGGDALWVASAIAVVSLGWLAIYTWFSFRNMEFRVGFCLSKGLLKCLLGKGLGFQASALWQALLFQASIVLANSLFGPIGAATWGTLRTLSRAGNQALSIINQTLMPELQKAISLKAWIDARKLHTIGVMVSGLVGLCAAAGLATFGNWIYSYWTAGELSVPFLVWPILGVGIMLNSLWWTSGLVHRATNQPWGMNLMGVVGALLTLGIMKVLGKAGLGISGFAFGAVVFEIIMASYVLRRSLEIMSDRPADFFIRMYQSLNEFTLFSKRATKNKLNVHIHQ